VTHRESPPAQPRELTRIVLQAVRDDVPLLEAVQQLRAAGHTELPQPAPPPVPAWSPAQAQALGAVMRGETAHRAQEGSIEIPELVRRHLEEEVSSISRAPMPEGEELRVPIQFGISSPGKIEFERPPKPFWFKINAELVIYGSTEPNASVSINGRPIKLRQDGSFSYRFALPDGNYAMIIEARDSDGLEHRSARLRFSRATQTSGEVGRHPQDPRLKSPAKTEFA
jgi:hypothetical protein